MAEREAHQTRGAKKPSVGKRISISNRGYLAPRAGHTPVSRVIQRGIFRQNIGYVCPCASEQIHLIFTGLYPNCIHRSGSVNRTRIRELISSGKPARKSLGKGLYIYCRSGRGQVQTANYVDRHSRKCSASEIIQARRARHLRRAAIHQACPYAPGARLGEGHRFAASFPARRWCRAHSIIRA